MVSTDTSSSPRPSGKSEPKTVIVIGAGMAGLTAAYELARAGHQVHILEASHRVGGRVHTWRGFPSGLYAEAGAAHIAEHHGLTRAYCTEFGLKLRPAVVEAGEALVHLGGRSWTHADVAANPDLLPGTLAGPEKGKPMAKLWKEATHSVRAILEREGPEQGWRTIGTTYERLTLHEFLEQAGWSEEAIGVFARLSQRQVRLDAPAVDQLRELIEHARAALWEIEGGNDRLPQAMFARLADRVRFGARALSVQMRPDDVSVSWLSKSGEVGVSIGDYVVIAVPVPLQLTMGFTPALSRAKTRAMRAVHYPDAVVSALQYTQRFWTDQPLGLSAGGTTVTDRMLRRLTYPTHQPEGTVRGLLRVEHAWNPHVDHVAALGEQQRLMALASDIEAVHGAGHGMMEHGCSLSWREQPYAGGSVALFTPQDQAGQIETLAAPEHRMMFAGEHTSPWHGTVEGAVESGIRAARQVHAAMP